MINVYTDGCCNKKGDGAWACLIEMTDPSGNHGWRVISDAVIGTTNNRMELTPGLMALSVLGKRDTQIRIYSDSQYFVNGLNNWVHGWVRSGWKRVGKDPITKKKEIQDVKNQDLWKDLYELKMNTKKVLCQWVRGHNGHRQNELCDHISSIVQDDGIPRNLFFRTLEEVEAAFNFTLSKP